MRMGRRVERKQRESLRGDNDYYLKLSGSRELSASHINETRKRFLLYSLSFAITHFFVLQPPCQELA